MSEEMKRFLKSFGVVILQALGILALILIGLWFFSAFVIFGALSRM